MAAPDPLLLTYRLELLRRYPHLRAQATVATIEWIWAALVLGAMVLLAVSLVVLVTVPDAVWVAVLSASAAIAVAGLGVVLLARRIVARRRIVEAASLLASSAQQDGRIVADRAVSRCQGRLRALPDLLAVA